jgi:hypothetical protein
LAELLYSSQDEPHVLNRQQIKKAARRYCDKQLADIRPHGASGVSEIQRDYKKNIGAHVSGCRIAVNDVLDRFLDVLPGALKPGARCNSHFPFRRRFPESSKHFKIPAVGDLFEQHRALIRCGPPEERSNPAVYICCRCDGQSGQISPHFDRRGIFGYSRSRWYRRSRRGVGESRFDQQVKVASCYTVAIKRRLRFPSIGLHVVR